MRINCPIFFLFGFVCIKSLSRGIYLYKSLKRGQRGDPPTSFSGLSLPKRRRAGKDPGIGLSRDFQTPRKVGFNEIVYY